MLVEHWINTVLIYALSLSLLALHLVRVSSYTEQQPWDACLWMDYLRVQKQCDWQQEGSWHEDKWWLWLYSQQESAWIPLTACLSVCVRVQSEMCVKGQTLRDSLLQCQFYLQGLGRTFFSVVITLFLNKVRVALDQVRLSAHAHTQRRLLQVINNVWKAGNKELWQCPLLPSFCMCAGVGEDKHEVLELVCCLHGECVHAPLVFVSMYVCVFLQLCCFLLFPTASPNLSWLPLSSAEFTAHHRLLYLQPIFVWGPNKDKRIYTAENHAYVTLPNTGTFWNSRAECQ